MNNIDFYIKNQKINKIFFLRLSFVYWFKGYSFLKLLYLLNKSTLLKRLYFSSFWLLLIIFLIFFSLTYSQDKKITNQHSGIIFDSQINIWGEPNERSEVLFVLHEGTKVEVVDALGTWNKIKIVNGSEGWIQCSSLRMLN